MNNSRKVVMNRTKSSLEILIIKMFINFPEAHQQSQESNPLNRYECKIHSTTEIQSARRPTRILSKCRFDKQNSTVKQFHIDFQLKSKATIKNLVIIVLKI